MCFLMTSLFSHDFLQKKLFQNGCMKCIITQHLVLDGKASSLAMCEKGKCFYYLQKQQNLSPSKICTTMVALMFLLIWQFIHKHVLAMVFVDLGVNNF